MSEQTTVHVPATLSGMASLLTTFRTLLTQAGVPASIQRNVHAAVDELVANVVEHGGAGAKAHGVTMLVESDDERVAVELIDHGVAFDPVNAVPATSMALQVGGIGIQLARHWVDDVRYERRGDQNHVYLVKRR